MPDSPDDEAAGDAPSVLAHLIQRLKSQPFLLALGFLLVLASVATASVEALRALLPAALTLFAVAGERGRVSARRIGRRGEVVGVDDQSGAPPGGSTTVKIKADGVEGRVVG